jgi:hypothetical protein
MYSILYQEEYASTSSGWPTVQRHIQSPASTDISAKAPNILRVLISTLRIALLILSSNEMETITATQAAFMATERLPEQVRILSVDPCYRLIRDLDIIPTEQRDHRSRPIFGTSVSFPLLPEAAANGPLNT